MYGLFGAVILMLQFACQPSPETVIRFSPVLNNQPLSCDSKGNIVTTDIILDRLSWFVSELKVNGNKVFIAEGSSGHPELALLGASCNDSPNWSFSIMSEVQSADSLKFTLGVPFSLNHLLPLTQPPPLNDSSMFWSWQNGHKFLRLDISSPKAWSFHLGSTGCQSESAMRAPTQPCSNTNLLSVSLDNYQVDKPIIFNLSRLLAGVDILSDNHCMSQPERQSCKQILTNLATQTVFYQ